MYSDKVIDHYNNPRNVGSMDKASSDVGTGLVGAPECGDVMKLQIKVNKETGIIEDAKFKTFGCVGSNVPIAAPDGYKAASTIAQGMLLYSWDGSHIVTVSVEEVIKTQVMMCDLLQVDFGFRKPFVVSKDHIFMNVNGAPVEAVDLRGHDIFELLEAELRGLNNIGRKGWMRLSNKQRLLEDNPMFDPEVVLRSNSKIHQRQRAKLSVSAKSQTDFEKKFQARHADLPLEFVGTGELDIGGLYPDFLVSGTNKIIDLTSDVSWRLLRKTSGYEGRRREIFEGAGYSYLHFVDKKTTDDELRKFVHNGLSVISVTPITDRRGLRGLERQVGSDVVTMYDFRLSGPFVYFIYRAASHNCGSAIASSSLATEWVKGRTIEEALAITNKDIVSELSLPPVKIHCSVLAEDAIRAAIYDWKKKQG